MIRSCRLSLLLLGSAASLSIAVAGCSGGGDDDDDGRIDELRVGGTVAYCALNQPMGLAGATVTLTDFEGDILTATVGSAGLWQLEDVPEGVYTLALSLAGYQPYETTFLVSQPEGSPSQFVDAGLLCLSETYATATITPFSVVLSNHQTLIDGVDDVFEYSKSTDGDIVLTFDRPVAFFAFAGGEGAAFGGGPVGPTLQDAVSQQQIASSPNPAHTVYTITEAQLNAMNAGAGLTTSGALHFLTISNQVQYDPINGGQHNFNATLRFRATQ